MDEIYKSIIALRDRFEAEDKKDQEKQTQNPTTPEESMADQLFEKYSVKNEKE